MPIAVLVTGGAGYIGAHTCKALAAAGYLPVAYDNLSEGHRSFVRWGPLIEADIGDADATAAACRAYDVRAVIHFAAFALVGESVTDPAKYYWNNVASTLSLLRGLQAANVSRIVFSSSCAVYGIHSKEGSTFSSKGVMVDHNVFWNARGLTTQADVQLTTEILPCSNSTVTNNVFTDALINDCSPTTVSGNAFRSQSDPPPASPMRNWTPAR